MAAQGGSGTQQRLHQNIFGASFNFFGLGICFERNKNPIEERRRCGFRIIDCFFSALFVAFTFLCSSQRYLSISPASYTDHVIIKNKHYPFMCFCQFYQIIQNAHFFLVRILLNSIMGCLDCVNLDWHRLEIQVFEDFWFTVCTNQ